MAWAAARPLPGSCARRRAISARPASSASRRIADVSLLSFLPDGSAASRSAIARRSMIARRCSIVEQAHRSLASRFSRYSSSSASRGVRLSGSTASSADSSGSGACSGSRRREQGQIVEPGGNSAGRVASRFELGEHRARPGNHVRRKPGELGDGDAVAAVGGAVGDFVEQHEIALPLARADVVQRQGVEPPREPRQLVIMGREQRPAFDLSCIASTTAQAIASPS